MNARNLHICRDDKFYKGFIDNQQRFASDTDNQYIVVYNSGSKHKEIRQENVHFCNTREIVSRLKKCHQNFDQVIFHSLPTLFRRKFLPVVPDNLMITWLFYGYEYYHRREVIRDYLTPSTNTYYNSFKNPHFLYIQGQRMMDWVKNRAALFEKDLQRIHRFAHWNEAEYTLIRKRYNLTELKFLPFSMGIHIPRLVRDEHMRYFLIGHSGALTVNHLDGIPSIPRNWAEKFDRFVIPFSYGANKTYESIVRKLSYEKWGEKALLITKYVSSTSYFNILSRVKLAYMPQLRPSGGGNIRFFLQNNIPVVMDERSILAAYYRRMGVKVFSSKSFSENVPALSESDKASNQNFIVTHRGEDRLRSQYRSLLTTY